MALPLVSPPGRRGLIGDGFFSQKALASSLCAHCMAATVVQPAFALIFDLGQRFRNKKDAN
jgi:hypothetical protein